MHKRRLLLPVIFFVLFILYTTGISQITHTIQRSGYLREGPGVRFHKIKRLPYGLKVAELERKGDWVRIKAKIRKKDKNADTIEGWVHQVLLRTAPKRRKGVTHTWIEENLRLYPQKSLSEKPIRTLVVGETAEILAHDNTWYQYRLEDGTVGWVYKRIYKMLPVTVLFERWMHLEWITHSRVYERFHYFVYSLLNKFYKLGERGGWLKFLVYLVTFVLSILVVLAAKGISYLPGYIKLLSNRMVFYISIALYLFLIIAFFAFILTIPPFIHEILLTSVVVLFTAAIEFRGAGYDVIAGRCPKCHHMKSVKIVGVRDRSSQDVDVKTTTYRGNKVVDEKVEKLRMIDAFIDYKCFACGFAWTTSGTRTEHRWN